MLKIDRPTHLLEEFFAVESTGVKVAAVVETDDDRKAREIMEKPRSGYHRGTARQLYYGGVTTLNFSVVVQ